MATTLAHSPADVLRWLLVSDGILTDPALGSAWPGYASNEPDLPNSQVTLYDTQGQLDGRDSPTGDRQEHQGVMVRLRLAAGTGFTDGWAKMDAIRQWMDSGSTKRTITVGAASYRVQAVTRKTGVLYVGREPETNRLVFTINAIVALRQTA